LNRPGCLFGFEGHQFFVSVILFLGCLKSFGCVIQYFYLKEHKKGLKWLTVESFNLNLQLVGTSSKLFLIFFQLRVAAG